MAETTDKNASYVRTTALTEHESKSNSQEPRPGGFQGSTMKWFTGCVMWDKLQHEKSVRCGGERRLTGSWIRALKCTRALRCLSPGLRGTGCSFNVRFQNKRTDLGSSAALQWWMASSCDLSVFTTRPSKNMIDHHAMGESGEGLEEELSDCWSKMEPSVKVKQSHHSIPPVPWFQDHLLTWAKVWYSLI